MGVLRLGYQSWHRDRLAVALNKSLLSGPHVPICNTRHRPRGQWKGNGQKAPAPVTLAQRSSKDICWKGQDSHLGLSLWSHFKFLQSHGRRKLGGSGNFLETWSLSGCHQVLLSQGDVCIVLIL